MKSNYLKLLGFYLTLTLTFSACSKNIKSSGTAGDGTGAYGSENLTGQGALPDRPTGNPDNADYSILQAYTVYFDFDSFSINAGERSKLNSIAKWMTENPGRSIALAGHTDVRGTTQYNVGLGERRALATRDYLLGLGADGSHLITVSYGEERPADTGEGESAHAKNRRCAAGVMP
jgi:peptidoglycan-associated lipoprotein